MNTFKLKIFLLTLWISTSFVSLGQDFGKFGIRAGATMPSNILNTLLSKGVGLGIQANSSYFYQVRGRFTAEAIKYTPSDQAYVTSIYNYNTSMIEVADLTCRNFATLDGAIGLDYKILPDQLPWFYCGPEVLVGMDLAGFTYSNANFLDNLSVATFLHSAFKLNFGFEKSLGPINIFGEYSLMRTKSQIYDVQKPSAYSNGETMFNYYSHKFTVGIKF
jgi:hypothetical protein